MAEFWFTMALIILSAIWIVAIIVCDLIGFGLIVVLHDIIEWCERRRDELV